MASSIDIYGTKPYARVHLGHLSESRSAPGGRQLVGQAANLTFESAYRPNIRPSPYISILNHEVDTRIPSHRGWKAESTLELH